MQRRKKLTSAVAFYLSAHWTSTVQTYLSRITKERILAAVREAIFDDAATRFADLTRPEMAQAAEQLLVGTGWLPSVLRTARPLLRYTESEAEAFAQAAE